MRLVRLLIVVLVLVVAGRTAAGQDIKAQSNKPDVSDTQSNYVRPFVAPENAGDSAWPKGSNGSRQSYPVLAENDACLTLHTFVVARDGKQSDSTHLVAQRTCTPSRQFQMKSAVVQPTVRVSQTE
jgi:hypothetical protein